MSYYIIRVCPASLCSSHSRSRLLVRKYSPSAPFQYLIVLIVPVVQINVSLGFAKTFLSKRKGLAVGSPGFEPGSEAPHAPMIPSYTTSPLERLSWLINL